MIKTIQSIVICYLFFLGTTITAQDIGGFIYHDFNANGIQDPGDLGLDNITINVYFDTNGNSNYDAGTDAPITTLTTAGGGFWSYTATMIGDHFFEAELNGSPFFPGWYFSDLAANNFFDKNGIDASPVAIAQVDVLDLITDFNNIDGAIFTTGEIMVSAWHDVDHDGIDNSIPNNLPDGVNVNLVDLIGNQVFRISDGSPITGTAFPNVILTEVPPGNYQLRFDTPSTANGQYYITTPDYSGASTDATDDGVVDDSDITPDGVTTPGLSHEFEIISQEVDEQIDGGFIIGAEIQIYTWEDLNADGIQDAGEPDLGGVLVEVLDVNAGLTVANDLNGAPLTMTTNMANPSWIFTEVPPGDYRVQFTTINAPQFYFTISDTDGNDDATDLDTGSDAIPNALPSLIGQGQSHEFNLESFENSNNPSNPEDHIDAGFFRAAEVIGYTWEDIDGNGEQDALEPGLADVTVELIINDGSGNPAIDLTTNAPYPPMLTTAADPSYMFLDVRPGQYFVRFTAPTAPEQYYLTQEDSSGAPNTDIGDSDTDSDAVPTVLPVTIGESHFFDLVSFQSTNNPSEPAEDVDAGFFRTASVGDLVFEDKNGNGLFDGTEPGFENIQVTLFNSDGTMVTDVFGQPVLAFTTLADGAYLFENLPPGEYYISFVDPTGLSVVTEQDIDGGPGDLPLDSGIDSDVDPNTDNSHVFLLESNEEYIELDAGFYFLLQIGDLVWFDVDNDGIYTVGEGLAENVQVDLYWDSDNNGATDALLISVFTDVNGNYLFTDLRPGYYRIVLNPVNFGFGAVLDGYESSTPSFDIDLDVDNDNNGTYNGTFMQVETKEFLIESSCEPIGDDGDNTTNLTVDFGLYQPPCIPNITTDTYLTCTDAEVNPICDIQELDGYCSILPSFNNPTGPNPLCGNNFVPNNTDWWSFIAGTQEITLQLIPSNCTTSGTGTGLQAGIVSDCSTFASVVCQGPCVTGTFSLTSSDFIPGEQYYFWVDGCAGSVCEYEIQLLSDPGEFIIPTPTDIICDLPDCDTANDPIDICLGATDINFETVGNTLDLTNLWTITPANADYPDGYHPSHIDHPNYTGSSSYQSSWNFNEEGVFNICNQVTNFCNTTPPICITINVEALEDEQFLPIDVCEGDFPFTVPSNLDPNGDGIGWSGGPISAPGGIDIMAVAVTDLGCEYNQFITINQLLNPPTTLIDTVLCFGENITVAGETITTNTPQPIDILLPGAAANGCDSTIQVTYQTIAMQGNLVPSVCEDGIINIFFDSNPDNFALTTQFDDVVYNWVNLDNQAVTYAADFDGLDDNLQVSQLSQGNIQLTVDIYLNGAVCTYPLGSTYNINIDFNDFKPDPPVPDIDWDVNLCEDIGTVTYSVVTDLDLLSETFTWTLDGVEFDPFNQSNELTIDWSTQTAGELCVVVGGGCGVSDPYCENITIVADAIPSIAMIQSACVDSITIVEHDGIVEPDYTFYWDFNGGNVQNGANVNGPGPFEVAWPTEGSKTVSLYIDNFTCSSDPITADVDIVSRIESPMLNCMSDINSVTLSWPFIQDAEGYEVSYENPVGTPNTVMLDDLTNMYVVDGLNEGVGIDFTVIAINSGPCGNSLPSNITCTTQNCVQPTLTFDIDPTQDTICLVDNVMPIEITVIIDDTNNSLFDSCVFEGTCITSFECLPGENATAVFDPTLAQQGANNILFTYYEEGCVTSTNATIYVFDLPDASFTQTADVICINEETSISYDGGSNPETFDWGNFGNATTVVGSGGNYTLSWDTPGMYMVSLSVERNSCESEPFQHMFVVQDTLSAPMINCTSTSNSVLFDWDDIPNSQNYELVVDGTPIGTQDSTSYFVGNLNPGDEVELIVMANSDNACPSTMSMVGCIAENCPNAIIQLSIPDTTICISQNMIIDIDADIDIPTTDGATTWSGNGVNPDTGEFDPAIAGVGIHQITYMYEELACSYMSSVTITVLADPVANFSIDSPICVSDIATINYTGDTGSSYSYSWSLDGGTEQSTNATGTSGVSWDSPGTYAVSIMINNGFCDSDLFTQEVIVDPVVPDPNIQCEPEIDQITFSWDSNECADMYMVFVDGVMVNTQSDTSYVVTGLTEGQSVNLMIEIIGLCSCPGGSYDLTCLASPCPEVMIDLSDNFTELCFNQLEGPLNLLATVTGGDSDIQGVWSGNGISDDGIWDALASGVGDYDFDYTYSIEGCDFTESVSIQIFGEPDATVIVNNPPCPEDGDTGSIEVLPVGGSGDYEFLVDGELFLNNIIDNITGGDHSLIVVDDNGCEIALNFTIELPAEFNIDITGDKLLSAGDMGQIVAETNIATAAVDSIVWTQNGVVVDCTSPPDCFTFDFTAGETTQEYCATLYYNGECQISDCLILEILPDIPQVYIPNSFSPNGDNVNDTFTIGVSGGIVAVNSFLIYDRWGELVFSAPEVDVSQLENIGWNGTFKGEDLQPGVYVYVISVSTVFSENETYTGDITIIR